MEKVVKAVRVEQYELHFDDGSVLTSEHDQDCCERHYLSFADLTIQDFEGLEFDLSNPETLIEKVPGYGIRLRPVAGFSVSIPGYGKNNGYYSSNLTLSIRLPDGKERSVDITECQENIW